MIAIAMAVLMCVLWVCAPGCAIGGIKGACRHKAMYSSLVWGEKAEVRIVRFQTSNPDVTHAQAQAYVDGKWRWLRMGGFWVYRSSVDNANYKLIEYLSPDEYLNRFFAEKE